jgi:long-subunit fatty acid transport protein
MELDIRRMSGNFSIPDWPSLVNVTGTISSPSVLSFAPSANSLRSSRPSMGLSLGADITLNQSWTLRTGFSQDQSTLSDAYVNPILGGAASSTFSAGFSYIGLGGEWSLGYQIRQSRDIESKTLDGSWNSGGFSPTGTPVGVEGMGHMIAIGYKTRF